MADEVFDVAIIGGGVVGCGAALDAATRGLRVALIEARDLASGTSSRSSKLIHGGLRYLEHLEFGLVSEALHERAGMLDRLAPRSGSPAPLPAAAVAACVGTPLRRRRPPALRHDGHPPRPRPRRARTAALHETSDAQAVPGAARGRLHRVDPVLRRTGRRRALHPVPRAHRGGPRHADRQPRPGGEPAARGRRRRRRRRRRPRGAAAPADRAAR